MFGAQSPVAAAAAAKVTADKGNGAGHGEETEWVNKLITKWRNDTEDISEHPAGKLKEWWYRTHGLGNPKCGKTGSSSIGSSDIKQWAGTADRSYSGEG